MQCTKGYLALAILAAFLAGPAQAERRALVVGIEQYAGGINRLHGPVLDARNMETLLKTSLGFREDQVKLLLDDDATRENVLAALRDWLVDGTSPGDEVVFYYSGHGYQQEDLDGDETDGFDETLVPIDTVVGSDRIANMISDDEVSAILSEIGDRRVKFIIDSCHSGTVTRGIFPDDDPSAKTPSGLAFATRRVSKDIVTAHRQEEGFLPGSRNLVVWTAVSSWQKALVDFEAQRGSVFTNRFVSGLAQLEADRNGDGTVTNAELLDFLRQESDAFCTRNKANCSTGLTPTLEASKDLLVVNAASFGAVRPSDVVPAPSAGGADGSIPTAPLRPVDRPGSSTPTVGEGRDPAPIAGLDPPQSESARPQPEPQPEPEAGSPQPTRIEQVQESFGSSNEADVRVSLRPNSIVRVGDTLQVEVVSPIDGFLVLLDLDAAGRLTQLFPNRFSQDSSNRVTAGTPVLVPDEAYGFDLEAVEPLGEGHVVALVVEDPIDLTALLDGHKDLVAVQEPRSYLQDIAASLRQVWTGDATNRPVRWSVADAAYRIVR